MTFAHYLLLGNLGEGGEAAEPNSVDPTPRLGDGGEQSIMALRFHCRFFTWLMNDAFHSRKTWRGREYDVNEAQGAAFGVAFGAPSPSRTANFVPFVAVNDASNDVSVQPLPIQ